MNGMNYNTISTSEQLTVPDYSRMTETEKIVSVIICIILIGIILKMFKVY